MSAGRRRSIHLTDDTWKRVNKKAARLTISEGKRITASDVIRRALDAYLRSSTNT